MGTGVRVFFVDDNDSLIKVPVARWERLNNNHSTETFREYAGKKVRYILAFLETENRKPVRFTRTECSYMFFDKEGKRDEEEWHKELQLVGQGMSWLDPDKKESNVIRAGDWFAQKTYQHKYKWAMTPELLNKVVYEVFP
jgi:hypothetical protein